MSKSQPIQEPASAEETAIRDYLNKFVVCRTTNGHTTKLHIPHPDHECKPACHSKRKHNGNSPAGPKEVEYAVKELSVYPPGWADYCLYCVEWWRNNGQ